MTTVADSQPSASPGPAVSTPSRRVGSVRRTTTHDSSRSDGLDGPVRLVARGRDLLTLPDGQGVVLDEAGLEIVVNDSLEGRILEFSLDPPHDGTDSLIGATAFAGFRRSVGALIPDDRGSGSVRFQILDDLPTALMLSGRVLRAAGLGLGIPMKPGKPSNVDICAGWIDDGVAVRGYSEKGPPLFPAPDSPPVEPADDPLGWHPHPDSVPHSTRRRRRLDLWRDGELARIDCFFRDSHFDEDGLEGVVHEWTVRAAVDPASLEVVECEAGYGALPFPECPGAAASAGRLVGGPLVGLRRRVLKEMVGTSTCTHLNDQLRSFEDVGTLLRRLDSAAD
ncbi:MAG TPA: DUF2889 domain-containing protein [Acidimicrobiales bacterium]